VWTFITKDIKHSPSRAKDVAEEFLQGTSGMLQSTARRDTTAVAKRVAENALGAGVTHGAASSKVYGITRKQNTCSNASCSSTPKPEPPPPQAAQAGQVLTQDSDVLDLSNTFVVGSGSKYAGGTTDANGTATKARATSAPPQVSSLRPGHASMHLLQQEAGSELLLRSTVPSEPFDAISLA
jgi:hypothetical protein